MKSISEKFKTVIEKNTFYFSNKNFEQRYEGYINSIKETLLVLKKGAPDTKRTMDFIIPNKKNPKNYCSKYVIK